MDHKCSISGQQGLHQANGFADDIPFNTHRGAAPTPPWLYRYLKRRNIGGAIRGPPPMPGLCLTYRRGRRNKLGRQASGRVKQALSRRPLDSSNPSLEIKVVQIVQGFSVNKASYYSLLRWLSWGQLHVISLVLTNPSLCQQDQFAWGRRSIAFVVS